MARFLTVSRVQQTSRVTGIIISFFSSSTERKSCPTPYNGYDGFHSRLMGVTEEQGPVMSSLETYPSRWLQLDTADRGSQSRVPASSIVLIFKFGCLGPGARTGDTNLDGARNSTVRLQTGSLHWREQQPQHGTSSQAPPYIENTISHILFFRHASHPIQLIFPALSSHRLLNRCHHICHTLLSFKTYTYFPFHLYTDGKQQKQGSASQSSPHMDPLTSKPE